jgi:hypothetical protein
MPNTKDISQRHDDAIARIAKALGVTPRELRGNAPENPPMDRALQMEAIAGSLERVTRSKATGDLREAIRSASDDVLMGLPGVGEKSLAQYREWADSTQEMSPVTVETVKEAPLKTTETLQAAPANQVDATGKTAAKG